MALYIPQSILHLAWSLYVRPETYGPTYVHVCYESHHQQQQQQQQQNFLDLIVFLLSLQRVVLDISIPVLKSIFNLILSQHIFPTFWKQAAIVPISKKGKTALINYYRPISIFNTFSKIVEIIIH